DDQGQVYLDFAGQGGTLSLGHNPAPVLEAVRLVAERPNLLQVGLDPVMSALMQNLAALAPEALARPLLTASGREAIRAAVGLARRATGQPRILVCEGASSDLSLDSWAAEPPPAETPTAAAPGAEAPATATPAPPGGGRGGRRPAPTARRRALGGRRWGCARHAGPPGGGAAGGRGAGSRRARGRGARGRPDRGRGAPATRCPGHQHRAPDRPYRGL